MYTHKYYVLISPHQKKKKILRPEVFTNNKKDTHRHKSGSEQNHKR